MRTTGHASGSRSQALPIDHPEKEGPAARKPRPKERTEISVPWTAHLTQSLATTQTRKWHTHVELLQGPTTGKQAGTASRRAGGFLSCWVSTDCRDKIFLRCDNIQCTRSILRLHVLSQLMTLWLCVCRLMRGTRRQSKLTRPLGPLCWLHQCTRSHPSWPCLLDSASGSGLGSYMASVFLCYICWKTRLGLWCQNTYKEQAMSAFIRFDVFSNKLM